MYSRQHLGPSTDTPLKLKLNEKDISPEIVFINGEQRYNDDENDMETIFLAQGPAFRNRSAVRNMRTI